LAFAVAFAGIVIAFVAVFVSLLIPLLPIAFLVFCVWAVVQLASPPAPGRALRAP
jgi:hypothetical protein